MNRIHIHLISMSIFITLIMAFQNCMQKLDIKDLGDASKVSPLEVNELPVQLETVAQPVAQTVAPSSSPPVTPPVVCNPFGGTSIDSKKGLIASLSYLKPTAFQNGTANITAKKFFDSKDSRFQQAEQKIYFSRVDTKAQEFSVGFRVGNGDYLRYSNGQKMDEWFALKYETIFKLSAQQKEGYYSFGTLSDDGTVLEAFIDNEWKVLVNNDGTHSPTLRCQSYGSKLFLDANTRLKLRLYFYQGPRVTIANTLLIKKISDSAETSPGGGYYCPSAAGDDLYWNRATGEATQALNEVFSNGWSVPESDNFVLPVDINGQCMK